MFLKKSNSRNSSVLNFMSFNFHLFISSLLRCDRLFAFGSALHLRKQSLFAKGCYDLWTRCDQPYILVTLSLKIWMPDGLFLYRKIKGFFTVFLCIKIQKSVWKNNCHINHLLMLWYYHNPPSNHFKYAMTGGVVIITCHCFWQCLSNRVSPSLL